MKRLLIKYSSEIALKKQNRRTFEDILVKNIRNSVGKEYKVIKDYGRMYMDSYPDEAVEKIKNIFGVLSVTEADVTEKEIEKMGDIAVNQLKSIDGISTFRVSTARADKSFPLNSIEVSKELGGIILDNIPNLKVELHNPDIVVNVEIRDRAYIYSKEQRGVRGLPYRTSGKGILLLSGGIDSPVAGYMMARRGLEIVSVYYHSHPYTSERAKEKVISLAKCISKYTGSMKLYIVPFTNIQMDIIDKCREDELVIIMRRFMMKIAEEIGKKEGALSIVTGESLGQVASQTLESMYVTNNSLSMPVFRPLIGMDKVDIMDISREIGTYDTSILPFEDCCTIFVPKHPKTKPRLSDIQSSEKLLDFDKLVNEAIENSEIVTVTA
jgi:thiamine biosynthesis protein ThiI